MEYIDEHLVTYDWFEREYGSQYKLSLTKEQYDRMKSIVAPIGKSHFIQLEFIFFLSLSLFLRCRRETIDIRSILRYINTGDNWW